VPEKSLACGHAGFDLDPEENQFPPDGHTGCCLFLLRVFVSGRIEGLLPVRRTQPQRMDIAEGCFDGSYHGQQPEAQHRHPTLAAAHPQIIIQLVTNS
jgi:hypothetical protein